jgi:hypothetical protein
LSTKPLIYKASLTTFVNVIYLIFVVDKAIVWIVNLFRTNGAPQESKNITCQ